MLPECDSTQRYYTPNVQNYSTQKLHTKFTKLQYKQQLN